MDNRDDRRMDTNFVLVDHPSEKEERAQKADQNAVESRSANEFQMINEYENTGEYRSSNGFGYISDYHSTNAHHSGSDYHSSSDYQSSGEYRSTNGYNSASNYQSASDYQSANSDNAKNNYVAISSPETTMGYQGGNSYSESEQLKTQTKKREPKRKTGLGFAKVAVLLIISCAILGLGLGFGYKWAEHYFAGDSLLQNASNSERNVDGANVISSESSANSQDVGQADLTSSDIAKAINNPLNGSVSLADIAENTKKAVVAITSHEITRNYIMGEVEVPTSGTGIVYQMSADKIYIVTNSHVVGEGETSVKFEHQNEPVDVEFIGRDEVTDVAVLSVNKSDVNAQALAYIKPIKFANSDKVRVGDFVMVVGNPLGYDYTTTFGIVSGLNRNTQLTSEDLLIQVDAAVNRGNSGGPLVNMAGELIGVINQKMNNLTAEGIGFAIPANRVMEDIKFLVENKENPSTSQAFLGITGEAIDESASEYYKLPLGVLVRSTLKGAGAEAGGIKEGDIIIDVDGKKITNMVELQRVVSRKKPNEEINIKVFRVQVGEMTLKVKLSDKSKFKLNRE